jgi:hypothetical protein
MTEALVIDSELFSEGAPSPGLGLSPQKLDHPLSKGDLLFL